jgi:hypothetical protein
VIKVDISYVDREDLPIIEDPKTNVSIMLIRFEGNPLCKGLGIPIDGVY